MDTIEMEVGSAAEVKRVAQSLISKSRWFEVTPLPDDHYGIRVKAEDEKLLKNMVLPDLTHEQKIEYIEGNSAACPFCKSNDIDAALVDVDSGSASQEVWCQSCHRTWYDVYKLVDVEAKR